MAEFKKQIPQVIREINDLTTKYYQQKISEGNNQLNITLNNIMNIMQNVFQYKNNHSINYDENKMIRNLTEAMNAMEHKDYVLLADILKYEIAEQLQELESCLTK